MKRSINWCPRCQLPVINSWILTETFFPKLDDIIHLLLVKLASLSISNIYFFASKVKPQIKWQHRLLYLFFLFLPHIYVFPCSSSTVIFFSGFCSSDEWLCTTSLFNYPLSLYVFFFFDEIPSLYTNRRWYKLVSSILFLYSHH